MSNFNFAIGVYPRAFGFYSGNDIETFLDVQVTVHAGRINTEDQDTDVLMRRCNQGDISHFNTPLIEHE